MSQRISINELRQDVLNYHELRSTLGPDTKEFFNSVYQDMHTLDAKTTGLITLITLAVAALTFSLGLVDQKLGYAALIKTGIIGFIGIFSSAGWFSLRCLEITGPPFTEISKNPEEYKQSAVSELAARRYNYYVSLRITRGAFTMLAPFVIIWVILIVREFY